MALARGLAADGRGGGHSWIALSSVAAFAAIVVLTARYDAAVPLLMLAGTCLLVGMLLWPRLATVAVVFILYSNLPAVAVDQGVPHVVAGSFLLLLGIPLLHLLSVRRERLRMDRTLFLLLVFLGAVLLSTLKAVDPERAAVWITEYVVQGVVVYWLLINVVRRMESLRAVLWAAFAAAALLSGLTAFQAATGDYDQQFLGLAQRSLRFAETKEVQQRLTGTGPAVFPSDRAAGSLGDPNRFAQILIVLLPLAWWNYRRSPTGGVRTVAAGAGLLILLGILLTYSRGAFVTLVLVTPGVLWARWARPSRLIVAGLGVLAVMALFMPQYFGRIATLGRATALVVDRPNVQADGSIRGRATEMMAATRVFLDNPILGVGPAQYARFYSVEYQQDPSTKFRDIRIPRRAHSLYAELATEHGLLGLLTFLSIFGTLMWDLARAKRFWEPRDRERADLAAALVLSLSAYLVTGLFLHLSWQRYLWFLIAVAGASLALLRPDDRPGPVARPPLSRAKRPSLGGASRHSRPAAARRVGLV